jgi:SNF2 family DNA or RNA helicase
VTVRAEVDRSTDKIWLESEWRWREQIKLIPGSKWSTDKTKWSVPLTWSSCLALRATLGSELELGENLKEWAANERTTRIDPCLSIREATGWEDGDPKLFWWQRSGAHFIAKGKQVIIADDPGAGKTATTIRGLAQLQSEGENVFPVLVICPTAVKQSWAREFDQWWPGLTTQVVKGTTVQRRKQLATPAHVYVMNIESIRSHSKVAPYGSTALKKCIEHGGKDPKVSENTCQVHEKELNRMEFGAVVLDEAHRIKDGKAVQSRAIKAAAGKTQIRVALTGTPTSNDVTDLWSILNFLSPVEFASKTRWIDRYIETMQNAFGGLMVLGVRASAREEFDGMLNPRMRRMTEDQVLDFLPPIIYERRDCEMSTKQAKAYKDMRDGMIAELEGGKVAMATSALTQSKWLGQFASSFAELEVTEETDEYGFTKVRQHAILTDPSAKLDAFMEEIPTFAKEQVAVMAVSRQLIKLLSKRLEKAGIKHGCITGDEDEDERQEAMDLFQAGKIQYILFTTAAGGTGVTLTAARFLCRLQIPYSFVDYKQSLRRVRRIGSERHDNIIVLDFVTTDTIDEHVFDVVAKKEENFEDVVRDKDALIRMIKAKK